MDEYLERQGLGGFISSTHTNTTYLTNFPARDFLGDRLYNVIPGSGEDLVQSYGVYAKGGTRALVLPLSHFLMARFEEGVASEIYTYGKPPSLRDPHPRFDTPEELEFEKRLDDPSRNFDSPELALRSAVKDLIVSSAVGVDFAEMSDSSRKELRRLASSFEFKNGVEFIRMVRMAKSKEEIRRFKKASEINERAIPKVFDAMEEGVSEKELRVVYAREVVSEGALFETGHLMVPTGTKSGARVVATDSKLASGTAGMLDATCSYMGYYSDVGDSFVLGKPSEKLKKYYDTLERVNETCEEIIAPFVKPSELNKEAAKIWEKRNLPVPPTGMGHGLGLEVHEYPRITAAKGDVLSHDDAVRDDVVKCSVDIPFEEGMILAIEQPCKVWGWGGVHFERNFLVGKNGCRRLTVQERFLRILG
ncbi:MAG: Xaa-Pro peptidase family protein [Thaumarchaeota archaeon]|nr:Xaa-Pro peptidase family protein [Nitrososphaerota archaeon]